MKVKNLLSVLYPILFVISDYIFGLVLITTDRFDWLGLTMISAAGIMAGIIAEILIVKYKINVTSYWKSIISSITAYILLFIPIFTIAGSSLYYTDFYSFILKLLYAVQLLFPVIMSVYWIAKAEKTADKIVLAITNPIFHFNVLLYIINELLSAIPT